MDLSFVVICWIYPQGLGIDHTFNTTCAQVAPVTRICGFLVQLVLKKKEKIKLKINKDHRNINETWCF